MNINFTGRGYELDELTRDYANKKISRLVRFLEEPIEIHIILEREKLRLIAEIHASHRHGVFQATEETEDMRDSIHAVIHKVEKQARRARKK
ncbi:MAG: ribosome-associated translation inhibitor RaiA, partial [Acidobacteriota bacterium]